MARTATGRRMHAPAFDELLQLRGLTRAKLAGDISASEGHLADLRSGRRLVSPPVAAEIAAALNLSSADAFLWPAEAEELRKQIAA